MGCSRGSRLCPPPLQIRRRRPTPANLVLSSDQSSPGGSPKRVAPRGTAWHRVAPRGTGVRHPTTRQVPQGGDRRGPVGATGGWGWWWWHRPVLFRIPGVPQPIHLRGKQLPVTRGTAWHVPKAGTGRGTPAVTFESLSLPPAGIWPLGTGADPGWRHRPQGGFVSPSPLAALGTRRVSPNVTSGQSGASSFICGG